MEEGDWTDQLSEWTRKNLRYIRWVAFYAPVLGGAILISQLRSFKRMTKNSLIPRQYFTNRTRLPGFVHYITIEPKTSELLIHVSHTPYLQALLWRNTKDSEGLLKIKLSGIKIFPSTESIEKAKLLFLQKQIRLQLIERKEILDSDEPDISAILLRYPTIRNWHSYNLNLTLVSSGSARVRQDNEDWQCLKSSPDFNELYDELIQAENKAKSKNIGHWKTIKKESETQKKSDLAKTRKFEIKFLSRKKEAIGELWKNKQGLRRAVLHKMWSNYKNKRSPSEFLEDLRYTKGLKWNIIQQMWKNIRKKK